jgi:hypothetical protein
MSFPLPQSKHFKVSTDLFLVSAKKICKMFKAHHWGKNIHWNWKHQILGCWKPCCSLKIAFISAGGVVQAVDHQLCKSEAQVQTPPHQKKKEKIASIYFWT